MMKVMVGYRNRHSAEILYNYNGTILILLYTHTTNTPLTLQ
jgi:hypothetical protein